MHHEIQRTIRGFAADSPERSTALYTCEVWSCDGFPQRRGRHEPRGSQRESGQKRGPRFLPYTGASEGYALFIDILIYASIFIHSYTHSYTNSYTNSYTHTRTSVKIQVDVLLPRPTEREPSLSLKNFRRALFIPGERLVDPHAYPLFLLHQALSRGVVWPFCISLPFFTYF